MILQYLVVGVVLTVTTLFLYFKWIFSYWRRKDIPYIAPSIPMGNLENPITMKRGLIGMFQDAHNQFKANGDRFGGIFIVNKPILLFTDPDLIKRIMTNDFNHFVNHGNYVDEEKEPLSANLLNMEDDKWRELRAKLTPTFTSGKMKMMYTQIMDSAKQMVEHLNVLTSQNKPFDIKEITSCYSTDIIGSCAFGLDCNTFKYPDSEFRKYSRLITDLNFAAAFRMFITFIFPEVKKVFPVKMFRQDVEDFFSNAFKEVIDHRKATDVKRNDFIQLLLELGPGHGGNTNGLTTEQMLAQSFIFFGAGLETSATNLAFSLYQLAIDQNIQDKLREEILEVVENHKGQLTYEAIKEMTYMDQVVNESLRRYPPLPLINRKCTKDYVIPGTDVTVEKGTSVMISVLALHNDPEYFPDPKKFDPNRFSKENKSDIRPFTFIPFGDGPRICIGQRFALLQNKVALAMILKNFKILPDETTPEFVEINPRAVSTVSAVPIILRSQAL